MNNGRQVLFVGIQRLPSHKMLALYRLEYQRMMSCWFYEHLILSNFSQISKVKCFNNSDNEDSNNVTIVVLNKIGEYSENGKVFPQVSQTTLCRNLSLILV